MYLRTLNIVASLIQSERVKNSVGIKSLVLTTVLAPFLGQTWTTP